MKNTILISLCIGPSLVLNAAPHEHTEHGAHVHGEATLQIVLEKNELAIELTSPAANIVGFEHQPKNAEQKKAVTQAMKQLKQTDALFLLPAAAQCAPEEIEVASSIAEDEHEHHEKHGSQEKETHSAFTAHYHFHCEHSTALTQIEMAILNTFPGIESLDVQSISPRGQHKTELTPANKMLDL